MSTLAGPPHQAAAPKQVTQPSPGILQAQMQGPDVHALPYKPTLKDITEAQKYSKYAMNALGFEDIPTATKYLQQALDLLKGPKSL
jgi:vacuolar protein sorting-associated protein VTA1